MRHLLFSTLALCLIASLTSCGNKQAQTTGETDSTATKDTIVAEKVEP